jgi:hypothetical protein
MRAIMVWNIQAYRKNSPSGEPSGPYSSAEAAIKAANAALSPAIDEVLVYSPLHREQAFLRLKSPTKDIVRLALGIEQKRRKAESKVSSETLTTKPIQVDWTGRTTALTDTSETVLEAKVNGAKVDVHVPHEALEEHGDVRCKEKAREKLEQAAKTGSLPSSIVLTADELKK